MKQKRKKATAADRLRIKFPPSPVGKASDYIDHLPDVLRDWPDVPLIYIARESGLDQLQNGNLDRQIRANIAAIKKMGGRIAQVYGEVESGRVSGFSEDSDRVRLVAAAKLARRLNGVLVAESTGRFVRGRWYTKRNQRVPTLVYDFQFLRRITAGVRLATILHPDATPSKTRSVETIRGQSESGRKGGRPKRRLPKKHWEPEKQLEVIEHFKKGLSHREIVAETGVPLGSVQRWVSRFRELPKGVPFSGLRKPRASKNAEKTRQSRLSS